MKVTDIRIGERVRQDMGDLEGLMASIRKHGLLQPVVVMSDGQLIAGHRRLEAFKLLGRDEVPATVIDPANPLSAERDENSVRKNLTPSEMVAIGRLIEAVEKPKAKARHVEAARRVAKGNVVRKAMRVNTSVDGRERNPSEPKPKNWGLRHNKVAEIVAKAVGIGAKKYNKAKAVVAAAEANPDAYGDLRTRMDETGNVGEVFTELQRRKGNGGARHPVHRRSRKLDVNRMVQSIVFSLVGLCDLVELINSSGVNLKDVPSKKATEWSEDIMKHTATLRRFVKQLKGEV